MKLELILSILIILSCVSVIAPIDVIVDSIPDWERFVLDEEANKDKLYCRTTVVNGDIIETRWYNSFINPSKEVRVDDGDTTTPNCKYPQHEPVYAVGSNEGKVYSRKVFDEEGNVMETIWHNACSDEIERIDEGDTTDLGSNEFKGECYHPDYATNNGETIDEEIEEEVKDTPVVTLWNNIANWFINLFNM